MFHTLLVREERNHRRRRCCLHAEDRQVRRVRRRVGFHLSDPTP